METSGAKRVPGSGMGRLAVAALCPSSEQAALGAVVARLLLLLLLRQAGAG